MKNILILTVTAAIALVTDASHPKQENRIAGQDPKVSLFENFPALDAGELYENQETSSLEETRAVPTQQLGYKRSSSNTDFKAQRISVRTAVPPGHNLCLDKTCENVPNYPVKEIEKALGKVPTVDFFGADPPQEEQNVPTSRSGARGKSSSGGMSLCESVSQMIYPKSLMSVKGQEEFIVQNTSCNNSAGKTCYQAIRIVKCSAPSKPCRFVDHFPRPSETVCEQQYSYRRLMVFNTTGHNLESQQFHIPCGCVCKVNLTPELGLSRRAGNLVSSVQPIGDKSQARSKPSSDLLDDRLVEELNPKTEPKPKPEVVAEFSEEMYPDNSLPYFAGHSRKKQYYPGYFGLARKPGNSKRNMNEFDDHFQPGSNYNVPYWGNKWRYADPDPYHYGDYWFPRLSYPSLINYWAKRKTASPETGTGNDKHSPRL